MTQKITKSMLSDGPSAKEQYEAMEARIASRKAAREAGACATAPIRGKVTVRCDIDIIREALMEHRGVGILLGSGDKIRSHCDKSDAALSALDRLEKNNAITEELLEKVMFLEELATPP